ncbi:hypothetical protein [Lysinibacillus sphaericus]|uniref:hypothetical protein n=1 Tax=Lysinibacillus sphaericus TaxID=1421 RepID=UPI0018CD768E|nr:hypothetical protein [Lysinibacillus sphaericus]
MAIKSGFHNSINGDRKFGADFFALFFGTLIANGVFPNPSTGLQVTANSNMTTSVKAGKGWINGYFIVNDGDYVLKHDNADGVLKRIDRVVMKLNHVKREIEVLIKKGTFASSPVAPSLQRDADAYELALADVLINNGATQITQANITDQRLNSTVCGIVHGTVNQVDTTTIFNQYQAWFAETTGSVAGEVDAWQAVQKQEFLTWFESIKDILEGDVAANLAARIANLEQEFTNHISPTAIGAHKAKNIEVVDADNIFTAIDVEGVLKELFTNADSAQKGIANVVGSPAIPSNTLSQLKTHIQNAKNKGATNLTTKGQSSNGTESLDALMSKIANVNTGKKFASGVVTSSTVPYSFLYANAALTKSMYTLSITPGFKPLYIRAWSINNGYVFVTEYYAPNDTGTAPDLTYLSAYGTNALDTETWRLRARIDNAGTSNIVMVLPSHSLSFSYQWFAIGE